jgi:hypothetical protein
MPRSAFAPIEGCRFDDFLYAPVGDERNGMVLTVLSALARMDLDPWREAARLAEMSTEAATGKMRLLIAALPEEASAHANADAIATRLIALLPPRKPNSGRTSTSIVIGGPGGLVVYRVVVFLILMALLLGPQYLIRSAQSPAQTDSAQRRAAPVAISSSNPRP